MRSRIFKSGVITWIFILISSLIMSVNANSFPFSGKVLGTDSSVFVYVANVILDGGTPYLDTFDHKGPVIYLINVLGLLINKRYGLWVIEWITIAVIFAFAYKIARLMDCSRVVACIVVAVNALVMTLYFGGGNFTEEYACAFLMASLYFFVEYFKKGKTSTWKLIACGASFAAVFLLRINMVVLWGVMCVGVAIHCVKRRVTKDIFRFILWFVLGMMIVCVPIIVWFWMEGALTHFVEASLLFNFKYSSDPIRTSLDNKITSALLFFSGNPFIIAAPPLIYFCFSRKKLVDWLCFISLVLSVFSICTSGQTYEHYGMILCPLVVYSVSRTLNELQVFLGKSDIWKKWGVVTALLCMITVMFFGSVVTTVYSFLQMSYYPNPDDQEYQLAQIVMENTDESDKISVCGTHNSIYLLSGRRSVSRYSYQYPIAMIDPEIKADYLEDIGRLEAEVVLIDSDQFPLDDIIGIIETEYMKIAAVGNIGVYKKIP